MEIAASAQNKQKEIKKENRQIAFNLYIVLSNFLF